MVPCLFVMLSDGSVQAQYVGVTGEISRVTSCPVASDKPFIYGLLELTSQWCSEVSQLVIAGQISGSGARVAVGRGMARIEPGVLAACLPKANIQLTTPLHLVAHHLQQKRHELPDPVYGPSLRPTDSCSLVRVYETPKKWHVQQAEVSARGVRLTTEYYMGAEPSSLSALDALLCLLKGPHNTDGMIISLAELSPGSLKHIVAGLEQLGPRSRPHPYSLTIHQDPLAELQGGWALVTAQE